MTPDQYAAGVVREALKAKPRAWFWWGVRSFDTWFLDTFFPRTIWVRSTDVSFIPFLRFALYYKIML